MRHTVEVGELPISFSLEGGVTLGKQFMPFVSRKHPLLVVENSFAEIPSAPPKEVWFEKHNVFKISQREDGFLFEFNRKLHAYPKALLIHRHFRRATLFLRSKETPLFYPSTSYPWLYYVFHFLLLRGRGIFTHACGVNDRGRGLLFVGPSGGGKSTLARLFLKEKKAMVLNDDCTIVRRIGKKIYLFGAPWYRDGFPILPNGRTPLKALFFLSHARKNRITPLSFKESVKRLLSQTNPLAWNPEGVAFSVKFSMNLCAEIPSYQLDFSPTPQVISFLRNFLKNGRP